MQTLEMAYASFTFPSEKHTFLTQFTGNSEIKIIKQGLNMCI